MRHVSVPAAEGGLPAVAGIAAVAIDCAEPAPLARWWQGVLGGDIDIDGDGDASLRIGELALDFLKVPEAKGPKVRLHLDLRARHFNEGVRQLIAHGAVPAPDVYDGDSWFVFRDPEGNEACLLRE
ncbi:MAG TPA: VOC family protein [Mycobacteriales bacterium]|nr:VOC family protein [Mycobacteriales bacterium]